MKLQILAAAEATALEYQSLLQTPPYRKATKNMALAMLALERAVKPLQSFFEQQRENFGLVFTSQTGELETTLDFLKTWAEQKLARPLLFQNSLHNSTAGFVAIQARITGPVLSISPQAFTEEAALEAAASLLEAEQCQYCIVLSTNIYPQWEEMNLPAREELDGASCVILTKTPSPSVRSLGQIESLRMDFTQTQNLFPPQWTPLVQKQNILTALVRDSNGNKSGQISIELPWGKSELQWSPAE